MISYVRGSLTEKEINYVVVDVGGVGYQVFIPVLDYGNLPEINEQVKIHTYLYVKEDIMRLYGSLDKKTMEIFELLISVSGIGPKVATGILSFMDANTVIKTIIDEDSDAMSKCPGIGKKTAQKAILELKDKFKNYEVTNKDCSKSNKTCNSVICEAVEALQCLGYTKKVSEDAVNRAAKANDDLDISSLVKLALKELAK